MALRGWEDLDIRCQAVNHSPVLGLVHSAPKIHHHPNRPQRASPSLIRREVMISSPGPRPAASHAPATCPASLGPRAPPPSGRLRPVPPAALLSRPAAIAVALLLVGAVRRVPLELLGLVGQHHLHSLQSPGDGALLQCAAFLRGDKGLESPAGSRWATRGSLSRLSRLMKTRWTSFHVVRNAGSLFTSIPDPSSSILKDLHFQ